MKMKDTMLGSAAVACMMAVLGTGASAAGLTAIDISSGNTTNTNVFYVQSSGLTITDPNASLHGKVGQGTDSNVSISFPLLANTPGYTFNSGTGAFDQPLAGSSFTIKDNTTMATLLSGTFGAADLTGVAGSAGGNVNLQLQDLTYGPGSFFPAGYSPVNGNLSVEFTAAHDTATGGSAIVADSGGVHSFSATDGITYSAQPPAVPEPGSLALVALGIPGILGLVARSRKTL